MKATIGVYDSHEMAMTAVEELKNAGYPVSHISVIGIDSKEVMDNEMHVHAKNELSTQSVTVGGVLTGIGIGAAIGTLTGIGMFAIPGLGALYFIGALAGSVAGGEMGLVGGGIASALIAKGMHDTMADRYEKELKEGKFILVAHDSHTHIVKAEEILATHGGHTDLASHN
jgi:hypothetical protein